MTSALQKSECCSATSAAQLSEICSATSGFQGQMLAVWILAAKLPKSDLWIFEWIFSFVFSKENDQKKIHPQKPDDSLGHLFGKIPLAFS